MTKDHLPPPVLYWMLDLAACSSCMRRDPREARVSVIGRKDAMDSWVRYSVAVYVGLLLAGASVLPSEIELERAASAKQRPPESPEPPEYSPGEYLGQRLTHQARRISPRPSFHSASTMDR